MSDSLQRFVKAQTGIYQTALLELQQGKKETHWMWFIFPQLRGLGMSQMAHRYGIIDLSEAEAYLAHPVLGQRLTQCAQAMLSHKDKTADQILGDIDGRKLRSSMTLFSLVSQENSVFHQVLRQFYGGQPDPRTQEKCGR